MEGLNDPSWYRVAHLKPQLRASVRTQRRITRGRVWYLLSDESGQRHHRLDAAAWTFVGRFDGDTTLDDLWQTLHQRLGAAVPSQGDVVQLLGQLAEAGLLIDDPELDPLEPMNRRRERDRLIRTAAAHPLAFRVRLFDPSRLLDLLMPLARLLFSLPAAWLWLALLGWGTWTALRQGDALVAALKLHAQTPSFLLWMWLLYPLAKTLHELAHAMAVRVWGGSVRDMGITLMLLAPLPYVDASAATAFPSRRQRMLVTAAGMMTELAIAAAAVLLWSSTRSPELQQPLLALVASCGLSTLIFNANPLVRFDGYHLLCDALDTPNLHAHARAALARIADRWLGAGAPPAASQAPARTGPLALFALASWSYQGLVMAGAVWWLHGNWPAAALGVGAIGAASLLLPPARHLWRLLALDPRLAGRRLRVLGGAAGVALVAILVASFLPLPSATVEQGVLTTPPDAIVRAEMEGEVRELVLHEGQRVQAGDLVARLDNLALRRELATTTAQIVELDTQLHEAWLTRPAEAARLQHELDAVRARAGRLERQQQALEIRARTSGTFVMPREGVQDGHFVRRGQVLGHVLADHAGARIAVALTEPAAAQVRAHTLAVDVRLPDGTAPAGPVKLVREVPAVTRELPSALLGSGAGGRLASDPTDAEGRRALAPLGQVEVAMEHEPVRWIGARVWVRFQHPAEPLASRWLRSLQQAFLAGPTPATERP